jgi:hypothetical protein
MTHWNRRNTSQRLGRRRLGLDGVALRFGALATAPRIPSAQQGRWPAGRACADTLAGCIRSRRRLRQSSLWLRRLKAIGPFEPPSQPGLGADRDRRMPHPTPKPSPIPDPVLCVHDLCRATRALPQAITCEPFGLRRDAPAGTLNTYDGSRSPQEGEIRAEAISRTGACPPARRRRRWPARAMWPRQCWPESTARSRRRTRRGTRPNGRCPDRPAS